MSDSDFSSSSDDDTDIVPIFDVDSAIREDSQLIESGRTLAREELEEEGETVDVGAPDDSSRDEEAYQMGLQSGRKIAVFLGRMLGFLSVARSLHTRKIGESSRLMSQINTYISQVQQFRDTLSSAPNLRGRICEDGDLTQNLDDLEIEGLKIVANLWRRIFPGRPIGDLLSRLGLGEQGERPETSIVTEL